MFDPKENNFEIVSHGVTMNIQRLNLPGENAFKVIFSSNRKPIIVARTEHPGGIKFWTSVPKVGIKKLKELGH